jgi:hypothetical protein
MQNHSAEPGKEWGGQEMGQATSRVAATRYVWNGECCERVPCRGSSAWRFGLSLQTSGRAIGKEDL